MIKKKIITGVIAAVLACAVGGTVAFAAGGGSPMMGRGHGNFDVSTLTDQQKADMQQKMQDMQAQRQSDIDAFVATLSAGQLAAFNEIYPQMTAGDQATDPTTPPQKPSQADMQAMKDKIDAFVATLTDDQKAAYEKIFGFGGGDFQMSDADVQAMQDQMAEYQQKLDAFVNSLTPDQKAAYDELQQLCPDGAMGGTGDMGGMRMGGGMMGGQRNMGNQSGTTSDASPSTL